MPGNMLLKALKTTYTVALRPLPFCLLLCLLYGCLGLRASGAGSGWEGEIVITDLTGQSQASTKPSAVPVEVNPSRSGYLLNFLIQSGAVWLALMMERGREWFVKRKDPSAQPAETEGSNPFLS